MNGIYLNENDIEIGEVDYTNFSVSIKSKNQNILKGTDEEIITLNRNVDTTNLLKITDVGRIYLPGEMYDNRADFFDGANNPEKVGMATTAYTMVFQNIGDKNPIFAYLAKDLASSATGILSEARQNIGENLALDFLKINLGWQGQGIGTNWLAKNGVFSKDSKTTTIKFEIVKEDRAILGTYRKPKLLVKEKMQLKFQ
ncbi:hypothetical protein SCLARK_00651 [Spiroplasma clarkii]|nr:hypothetical protein [Spiroplasma clarkii]ARU91314.1 hypothetical protein SCLARK_00651 [Spiroplasma clarkii]